MCETSNYIYLLLIIMLSNYILIHKIIFKIIFRFNFTSLQFKYTFVLNSKCLIQHVFLFLSNKI